MAPGCPRATAAKRRRSDEAQPASVLAPPLLRHPLLVARHLPQTRPPRRAPPGQVPWARLGGLALQVRDFLGLAVGLLLRAGQLVLRLALALLLTPLAAQRCVVGEVARGLLDAAGQLVGDTHGRILRFGGLPWAYPRASSGKTNVLGGQTKKSGIRCVGVGV